MEPCLYDVCIPKSITTFCALSNDSKDQTENSGGFAIISPLHDQFFSK